MDQARVFYEQAIALDPQFALAHSLLCRLPFWPDHRGHDAQCTRQRRLARALAQRALDSTFAPGSARCPAGVSPATYDYDWNEAARRFTLAIG